MSRAYRFLLLLYPRDFRLRFAEPMMEAFVDWQEGARQQGRLSAAAFYLRTLLDTLRQGVAERLHPVASGPAKQVRHGGRRQQDSGHGNLGRGNDDFGRSRRSSLADLVDGLRQDGRFAVRSLLRRPAFTIVTLLAVAIGVGANSAMFSVVNGVLLRPLSYHEPDQLVILSRTRPNGDQSYSYSVPDIRSIQELLPALTASAGSQDSNYTLTGFGEAELVPGARVTNGLLEVFAVSPVLGRDIRADEAIDGGPRVVVLGHQFWRDRYGSDPDVLGESLEINGRPFEIVGVAPEGFDYPSGTQLWSPAATNLEDCGRDCHILPVVARLAPGVSIGVAGEQLHALSVQLEEEFPESNSNKHFHIQSLQERIVGRSRVGLLLLLGAVGMVLLIACANVANLLLIRATNRAPEVAMRLALGASRGRILRQLLVEAAVLAAAGGALGLLLGAWGTQVLLALAPADLPRAAEVALDRNVVAFTVGVVALVGLLFGLVPALRLLDTPMAGGLGEASRSGSSVRGRSWSRSLLLTAEVALSVMLLLGAGLLLRTFSHLNTVDLGYETENIQLFALGLGSERYDNPDSALAFFETLETELSALPGVESVGSVFGTPLGGNRIGGSFILLDRPPPEPGQEPVSLWHAVSPGYFETLRIPMRVGRNFDRTDRIEGQRVAIISESFAQRYYPDEDPLGKQIEVQVSFGYEEDQPRTVIGVVADIRSQALTRDPQPELYVPASQAGPNYLSLAVRTAPGVNIMPAARDVIGRLDPNIPPRWVETLSSVVDRALGPTRFYAMLLIGFAGVALVLAAIGLYGVVGYLVAQRTAEIAVRMALGADRASVVRMVFAQGARPIIIGVIVGLLGAQVTARIIGSLLYGVEASDPTSAVASTGLLLATAFLALLVPAIRASRIAPMTALKQE